MSTVNDILTGIKNGLPNKVNLDRVNRAVRTVSKRLFYHKSTLVMGGLAVSVGAGASSAALPVDYWAMMSWPYVDRKKDRLRPVPDIETKLAYSETGQPIYFEVMGRDIYLYPGTSSAITIKGDYWTRPTALTALTNTMPYAELFDDAIRDALIATSPTEKGRNPSEGAIMQTVINAFVDEIVPNLDKKAPTRVDDNMGLDFMSEEDWF